MTSLAAVHLRASHVLTLVAKHPPRFCRAIVFLDTSVVSFAAVSPCALPLNSLHAALKQDDACLACHGQPGMKSDKGKEISIRPAEHAASVHGILGCKDCHTSDLGFSSPGQNRESAVRHVPRGGVIATVSKSIHAAVRRTVLRIVSRERARSGGGRKADASRNARECHQSEVAEFAASAHGRAARAGDPDAPTCASCHGPVHAVRSSAEAGGAGREVATRGNLRQMPRRREFSFAA